MDERVWLEAIGVWNNKLKSMVVHGGVWVTLTWHCQGCVTSLLDLIVLTMEFFAYTNIQSAKFLPIDLQMGSVRR